MPAARSRQRPDRPGSNGDRPGLARRRVNRSARCDRQRHPIRHQVVREGRSGGPARRLIAEQLQPRTGRGRRTKARHPHPRARQSVQPILGGAAVERSVAHPQAQRAIELHAPRRRSHGERAVIDAEEWRSGRALVPDSCGPGRRGNQISSNGWPSGSRNLNARTEPLDGGSNCGPSSLIGRHPACADKCAISSVHVVHDDRQMLKPQIVAPAVRRIRSAWRCESDQRDFFRAQPHDDLRGVDFRQAKRRQRRVVDSVLALTARNPSASR